MGNKASKPARKLTNTLSQAQTVTRSGHVPLPLEQLKAQYQQKSEVEAPPPPSQSSQLQFDSAYLHKKLKQKQTNEKKETKELGEAISNEGVMGHVPEGKDGFDPQMPDPSFVSSIHQLGRQIQSHSVRQSNDINVLALKQLKNRKRLFEQGQRELELQKDQTETNDTARTMVHPRTIGAILKDIEDPRVSRENILLDYQLHPDTLDALSKRFRVAKNVVVLEEQTKEDEIGHKPAQLRMEADDKMLDYSGELGENINSDRLKSLQSRLDLDR